MSIKRSVSWVQSQRHRAYKPKELEADITAIELFFNKCEIKCNSSKWRGLVTGWPPSNQPCLATKQKPTANHKTKRKKTKIVLSSLGNVSCASFLKHTPPKIPVSPFYSGLSRRILRREVYPYGGNRLFPELEKSLFLKPMHSTRWHERIILFWLKLEIHL